MAAADDDELAYEFLTEGVPALQGLAEIYISDELKRMEVRSAPKISAGVSLSGNLLELKLTAGDLSREELIEILSRYNRKRNFTACRTAPSWTPGIPAWTRWRSSRKGFS